MSAAAVTPGLVPGVHVVKSRGGRWDNRQRWLERRDVDGRDKPGHDGNAYHSVLAIKSFMISLVPP